jgi:hypothetical protein
MKENIDKVIKKDRKYKYLFKFIIKEKVIQQLLFNKI